MRLGSLILAGLLLTACGLDIKPGERNHARRDEPPGPGLLTGKQGEFVIYRLEEEPAENDEGSKGEKTSD